MTKVSVTYNAPADDNPVVTTRGVRFFDGQALELDASEHRALISKCRSNPHFEVSGGEASERMAVARAAKASKGAAKAEEPEE